MPSCVHGRYGGDKRPHEKRTKCGQKPEKNLHWLFWEPMLVPRPVLERPFQSHFNVHCRILPERDAVAHDEGMNEASYYLQHNEAGKFELNVSLFMGVSRPRKWVKVDLETKDQENAEARTRLILRLSYRLGLFPAGEVPLPKVKDPQGREKRIREGRQSGGKPLPRILTLK